MRPFLPDAGAAAGLPPQRSEGSVFTATDAGGGSLRYSYGSQTGKHTILFVFSSPVAGG